GAGGGQVASRRWTMDDGRWPMGQGKRSASPIVHRPSSIVCTEAMSHDHPATQGYQRECGPGESRAAWRPVGGAPGQEGRRQAAEGRKQKAVGGRQPTAGAFCFLPSAFCVGLFRWFV